MNKWVEFALNVMLITFAFTVTMVLIGIVVAFVCKCVEVLLGL